MIDYNGSLETTIYEFDPKAATIELEKIKSIISEAKRKDLTHRFLATFLLPAPLIICLRIRTILRSQLKLSVFASSIEQKQIPIVIATVLYFVMWLYLLPVIVTCWRLFHQIYTWSEFFSELWRWSTFQSLILISIHSFFAHIAINGFGLAKTFHDRYNLLRKLEQERSSRELIRLKANNQTIANAPELVTSLIHQTINALVASGKFSPENLKSVTETMKEISHQFLNSSDRVEEQPVIDLNKNKAILPDVTSLSSAEKYEGYDNIDFIQDK